MSYRLPSGERTDNLTQYHAAWRSEAQVLTQRTGWTLDSFDPGFQFWTDGTTLRLTLEQVRTLTAALGNSKPSPAVALEEVTHDYSCGWHKDWHSCTCGSLENIS